MKKILFPTEFSAHSPAVFRYAVELAYFFKAELVVMHAYIKPSFQATNKEIVEQMADVSTDQLMTLVNEHIPEAYKKQVVISYSIKVGDPAEAILQIALEENIDFIVMGMTGKTDALNTLFGSTSQEVLAKSDCPVLAIPTKAHFKGIDNIAYATNFEFRDLGAINYLKVWSKKLQSPLHCLHILEKKEDATTAAKNMNILSETYKGNKQIQFDIKQGRFEEEIEGFANSKGADVLAMISHKRHFLTRIVDRSAVDGLAKQISIPLLVIKDNAYEWDNKIEGWLQIINAIA